MFENGQETSSQSLDQFTQQLFGTLITATKLSNNLPAEDDYEYYASFKSFKTNMNDFGRRILGLTQNFLEHGGKNVMLEDDIDDVTDKFDEVVDLVDGLVEKVDAYTDEAPKAKAGQASIVVAQKDGQRMFHGVNIARPQDKFEDTIDNSDTPFIPKIREKPNALKPLDPIIPQGQQAQASSTSTGFVHPQYYPHPYEHEIRSMHITDSQLQPCAEHMYRSLEATPYTWIDTLGELKLLADKLNKVSEFAVDLEFHAYRSYQGFVCLMQISTRTEDFIVDTLALRSHMHILNSSFTNPKIVKVLHGSDSDVVWLQSDFGIYIVNLFDTGQASRVLDFPSFSLAYLLKFYCNVDADKQYQLADWRIRKLPAELIKYAREDTHYLLYIYDRLRNELVARSNQNANLLASVLQRSRELSLKRYEKERLSDESHTKLYQRSGLLFNTVQLRVFAALYKWRDLTARREDESPRYILPNNMLFMISEMMPTDVSSLIGCCNPVPPFVRVYAHDVVRIITEEKEAAANPQPARQPASTPQQFYNNTHDPRIYGSMFTPIQSTPTPIPSLPSRDTDQYLTHKDAPSPVLTTDQLYHTAGWVDPDSGSPPLTPRRAAGVSVKTSASLFPSEENDMNGEESSEDDASAKRTVALIRSSFAQQPLPFPSFPLPMSPPRKHTTIEDITNSSDDAAREAEEEDNEDSGESESDDEDSDEDATKDSEAQLSKSPSASKKVPRSMAEIYKLSNQNRKRNKEKKKLKEDIAAHPSSPVVLEDSDESEVSSAARSKRQKGASAHKKDSSSSSSSSAPSSTSNIDSTSELPPVTGDTVEFMKEIGWLDNDKPAASGAASGGDVKSLTPHQGKHSSTTSSSSSSTTHSSTAPSADPHHFGMASPPKSKPNKKRQPSPRRQGPPPAGGGRAPHQHQHHPHTHPHMSQPYAPPAQVHHFKPPPQGFVPFDYSNASFSAPAPTPSSNTAYFNPYSSMGGRRQPNNNNNNNSNNNANNQRQKQGGPPKPSPQQVVPRNWKA